MPECPAPREDHRDTVFVRCRNDFRVLDRPTRLHDSAYPGLHGLIHTVAKWEKGVRSQGGAASVVTRELRLVPRQERRVDPGHLTRTNPDRGTVLRDHDRV